MEKRGTGDNKIVWNVEMNEARYFTLVCTTQLNSLNASSITSVFHTTVLHVGTHLLDAGSKKCPWFCKCL